MANTRAQQMRRQATKAEWVLWCQLREYRAQGFIIRRQAPFEQYVLDFVAHRERLVIEVDGDQHGEATQRAHDEERTRFLESRGYCVLRYGNRDILTNLTGVIDGIEAMLNERRNIKFDGVPPPEPTSRSARTSVRPPRRGGGNSVRSGTES